MKRSVNRILTTHVGALHRPADLQDLLFASARGARPDERALAARLRSAVDEVVERQADVGIDIVNDGEYSKSMWTQYVLARMSGIEMRPRSMGEIRSRSRDRSQFKDFYADCASQTFYLEPAELKAFEAMSRSEVVCSGPLTYSEQGRKALQADIDNQQVAVRSRGVDEAFLPVVGPGSIQPYIKD